MKPIGDTAEFIVGKIVEITGAARASIVPETKITDICKDSIQIFSLIMALEKDLGFHAEYDDLICIETVGDAITFVDAVVRREVSR